MQTKPLLYGIIGFLLGGLVVSFAATNLDNSTENASAMSMSQMTQELQDKQGDAFDAAFIEGMIAHHEGAIAMARLSPERAKHDDIKQLSTEIIAAQQKEIEQMRQWQKDWGYAASSGASGHGGGH
ncbi:MAG TPA: DUF305 domain-containing protein [Candidatus Saccharimonadales bacterium]|nr:DUF305 domain-containing protein [Candidatus Saccharimonadales bacterium]